MGSTVERTASKRPILIAEDDKRTTSLLSTYLEREGFSTITAHDGREALELARRHDPIFVILDLMLPHVDGWEVCREVRRSSDVPILILSARGEAHERILGLSLGADDYVVKPFSPGEVVARVKTILRRMESGPSRKEQLSCRELVLDLEKHKVILRGRAVSLTPSEYKLLEVLMTAAGRIFLREELLNHLYPSGEAVTDRVIDVHIGNLRQKIEDDLSKPKYILTARGLGYQFADGDEQSEEVS
ncbi:MAG: response regulator transcription factor [Acidobacteria bacterium]|nr:response regulator transcription factor [Acidobacteriota bacterium]